MQKPYKFSLEFFPPRTPTTRESLMQSASILAQLGPSFLSMTYGAGGSSKDISLEMAQCLQSSTGVPTAAHLTYTNTTRAALFDIADTLWNNDIRHIVALRGDLPNITSSRGKEFFHDTSHFIAALRARHDFEISVGTYPEKHPNSKTILTDVNVLKKKSDAGATRAITQFFFKNDAFYRFRDKCVAAGVDAEIVPGLLPVVDFEGMMKFATKCAVQVPKSLSKEFRAVASPQDAIEAATIVLARQAEELVANDVSHVHFYTLNKAEPLKTIIQQTRAYMPA